MKRKRGTAIVETKKGILLTAMKDTYLLPGGGTEKGESSFIAAIRELKEETGLIAYNAKVLFKYISYYNNHTVVLIKAKGTPKPKMEVKHIKYYTPNTKLKMSTATKAIIKKYYEFKKNNKL